MRRESDYHTGLSFSVNPPDDRPYFVYSVRILEDAGYIVEFNEGDTIVSKWDASWALRDASGNIRKYGSGHVSVYQDHELWKEWYESELTSDLDGQSQFSGQFYEMAMEYVEG